MTNELMRKIIQDYIKYLINGGRSVRLPHYNRNHEIGLVHASDLMDCPLKAARGRQNMQPILPELAVENSPTMAFRMLQGERTAELIQEAFWYWSSEPIETSVYPEYSVADKDWQLQGRCDLFIVYQGKRIVIEIKHRMPSWKQTTPLPRIGDVFQLLAYHKMLKADQSFLLLADTPLYKDFHNAKKGFELFTLTPEDEGYIMVGERNEWADSFNIPSYINETTLKQEVQRQLKYINGYSVPPIDLSNQDEAWQCKSNTQLAHGGIGKIAVKCPYFCHTEPELVRPNMDYTVDDAGNWNFIQEEW
jgi:hypothetical protein